MTRSFLSLACACAMLTCVSFVRADDKDKSGSAQASEVEKCFIEASAVQNMFEVKLSEAAVQQASDQQVKQFAQQMIDDHKQAGEQNKQVADKLGVNVPNDLPKMKQKKIDAIKQQQGKDFDQAYLSCMKAAHLHDVSEFADQAQLAKNQDVKQFAQQLLPKLQQHQQHVISLASAQGLPSQANQAQPAGATISPSGSDQSQQQGASGSSSAGSSSSGTNTGDVSNTETKTSGASGSGASDAKSR